MGRRHVDGYMMTVSAGHPRACKGAVLEHILVVERVIGRPLQAKAVVHHVNEIKNDNRNENLVVLENQSEHRALHLRLNILRAGHDPWNERRCYICRDWKPTTEFYHKQHQCRRCSKTRWAEHQRRTRAVAAGRRAGRVR